MPLRNPVIRSMLPTAQTRTYQKGQTILYPGDTTSVLFIVKSGAISMHDIDDDGNQKILHIVGAGKLFPMVSFTYEEARTSWFYTALITTELYLFPYAELKKNLEKAHDSRAYSTLLSQMIEEVHELLIRLTSYTKTKSHTKIKAALQFLAAYHSIQRGKWKKVNFSVSHQLLADMTGLTRETVTLTLKDFQKAKVIKYSAPSWIEIQEEKLTQFEA